MAFGVKEAKEVQAKINKIAPDVQLFFDDNVEPNGIWVMCQVMKKTSKLILPSHYQQDGIKPYILWYIKDNEGRPRLPNEQDILDVIAVVSKAEQNWKNEGNDMADKLDEQSKEKDHKHREAFSDKIKAIAPQMKKAVRKELG